MKAQLHWIAFERKNVFFWNKSWQFETKQTCSHEFPIEISQCLDLRHRCRCHLLKCPNSKQKSFKQLPFCKTLKMILKSSLTFALWSSMPKKSKFFACSRKLSSASAGVCPLWSLWSSLISPSISGVWLSKSWSSDRYVEVKPALCSSEEKSPNSAA